MIAAYRVMQSFSSAKNGIGIRLRHTIYMNIHVHIGNTILLIRILKTADDIFLRFFFEVISLQVVHD